VTETVNIQETNGRSVTVALPDPIHARRQLIAKRVAAGADTPIGHRCSNLVELLDNYAKVESEEQRANIEASIRKQMADLARLSQ
jgi:hypothetical protein